MKFLIATITFVALSIPVSAADYSTKSGCMAALSEALHGATVLRNMPDYIRADLEAGPAKGQEQKDRITTAHREIAEATQKIADATYELCGLYE